MQTEYNQANQGRVAEQSTAEEMKDAWVVVAIVHLIRTEVLIQSEQTQEVVRVKRQRVQTEIFYNREKMQKNGLNYCDSFVAQEEETEGQKKNDNLCVRVLIQ